MSPDWSAKEEPVPYAKLDDPQSLNLYSYVRDNPVTAVDPDGHTLQDDMNSKFDKEHGTQWGSKARIATVNPTPFKTPAGAAIAAEKKAIALTNMKNGSDKEHKNPKTDWEFGGWIVKKGKSFYFTNPMQGVNRGEMDIDDIRVPSRFTRVAGYHTHPDGGDWGEGFSGYPRGDVGWSLNHPGGSMVGYVGMAFSGNVRVYIPGVTKYDPLGTTGDLVGNVYK